MSAKARERKLRGAERSCKEQCEGQKAKKKKKMKSSLVAARTHTNKHIDKQTFRLSFFVFTSTVFLCHLKKNSDGFLCLYVEK